MYTKAAQNLLLCAALCSLGCNAKSARKAEDKSQAQAAVAATAKVAAAAKIEAAKTPAVAKRGAAENAAIARAKAAPRPSGPSDYEEASKAPAKGDAKNLPANWALALKDPSLCKATAPDVFRVKMHTSKGDFTVVVHRQWAPQGADRFYNLVKAGFFKDIAFFRAVSNFMVQFGIHGDPNVSRVWRNASIQDDAVTKSNVRGAITFATRGKNTRTTQLFINFKSNSFLDRMGFSPFGIVSAADMKVVDSLYQGYGEGAPRGRGPNQMKMQGEGNTYLKADFPKLDYLLSATVLDGK